MTIEKSFAVVIVGLLFGVLIGAMMPAHSEPVDHDLGACPEVIL